MTGATGRPDHSLAAGLAAVALAAALVYAASLANGFAFDDVGVIVESPVVTSGKPLAALSAPWWSDPFGDDRLYRPLSQAAFAVQWALGDGNAPVFHAVNVMLHVLASILVTVLLVTFAPVSTATLGGLVFAVHPVHVEAVANVVGQAELWAACFFLAGVLAFVRGPRAGPLRPARTVAVGVAFVLALSAKEGAVTLPLVLLALTWFEAREGGPGWWRRVLGDAPLHLLWMGLLAAYLVQRAAVLGSVLGEVAHPAFVDAGAAVPFLTGLTLWPEYVRLLLFPLELSADYDPAVLSVPNGVTSGVVLGAAVLTGMLALVLQRRIKAVSLGVVWFFLAVLPVSHLILHPAVLLAERTLYVPSVGLSLVVAGVAAAGTAGRWRARWAAAWMGVVVLLAARAVARVPTWSSSFTVMATLVREHPESVRARLAVAEGAARVGELNDAAEAYGAALMLLPHRYGTLVEAARVERELGHAERAEALLARAIRLHPDRPRAYRLLAAARLSEGRARDALEVAAAGLAGTRDPGMWGLVSESHVLAGDLGAAIRARSAAAAAAPGDPFHRERLRQLRAAAEARDAPPPEVESSGP